MASTGYLCCQSAVPQVNNLRTLQSAWHTRALLPGHCHSDQGEQRLHSLQSHTGAAGLFGVFRKHKGMHFVEKCQIPTSQTLTSFSAQHMAHLLCWGLGEPLRAVIKALTRQRPAVMSQTGRLLGQQWMWSSQQVASGRGQQAKVKQ